MTRVMKHRRPMRLTDVQSPEDRHALYRMTHVIVTLDGCKPHAEAFASEAEARLAATDYGIDASDVLTRDQFLALYNITNVPVFSKGEQL